MGKRPVVVGSVQKPSPEQLLAMRERLDNQWPEVWRQFKQGLLTSDHMQALIEHRNPFERFERIIGVPILVAISILGDRKVLTAAQAAKAMVQAVPLNALIRYSEATLRECAEQNRSAGTDWRLVYVFGLSLRELHKQVGAGSNGFYNNNWWLKPKEDGWATEEPHAGYYLIDFNGRWGRTNWADQEQNIRQLGSDYERTHEAVITEAIFSIFQTTGERLLENWWHWGKNLDSCSFRVNVGVFGRGGLLVDSYGPDWDGGGLRVCVSRKFQK